MSTTRKILYASEDAYTSIKANLATTILSSVTVGFALALVALFLIIFVNLQNHVEGFGERTHIIAYLKENATGVSKELIGTDVKALPGLKEYKYITKDEALDRLKEELGEHKAIFEGIKSDIFPASVEIKVKDTYRDPEKILETVEELRKLKWVAEIQYGQENIEKFAAFLAFFKLAATILGIFLTAAVVFIISNTVRLTVYARKDSIHIMKLVGASDAYIKVPFFFEGILVGLTGGIAAAAMLELTQFFFTGRIPEYLSFIITNPFGWAILVILVIVGMVLGTAGCLISMRRFLRA